MSTAAPPGRHRVVAAPAAWGTVVTPHTPESSRLRAYPQLDRHRGAAVVAIVVFHVYQFCNVNHFLYSGTPAYRVLNSLDAAVPWFFVVTAFLVFEPIARSVVDGDRQFSARAFLSQRAVRLLPVYYVAVIVVWLLRQSRLPGDWRDLLEHLTFTQVFDEKRIFYTIGPAWAVSVAVFFYLALLVLSVGAVRICRRLDGRRQRAAVLAGAAGVLAVVSIGWKAWALASGDNSFTASFGPLASLDNFAVGMAVALVLVVMRPSAPLGGRARAYLYVLAVGCLAAVIVFRVPGGWTDAYFSTICSVGFGCLVAGAVFGPAGKGRRGGGTGFRVLPWLGTISLSVYLWHEPVILALRSFGLVRQVPESFVVDLFVVLAVSILIGWLSYSAIERPARGLAKILARRAAGS